MSSSLDETLAFDVAIGWTDAVGAVTTEYYSTIPRAGAAGDVTYAGFIDGRLKQVAIQEWLFGANRTRGPRQVGSGAIVLENGDGAMDDWASRSVHMCAVKVRRVNLVDPTNAANAEVIFEGCAELVEVDDSSVTVYVRDKTFLFDKPALQTQYAGTNVLPAGVEGGSEMKGMRKPWLIGTGHWVPLVCVNTSKLIFQVDGVDGMHTYGGPPRTVYDAGVALTYSGVDYANNAALQAAASPAAGQYSTCLAEGLVRCGSQPSRLTGWIYNLTSSATGVPTTGVTPATGTTGAEWHDLMASVARKVDGSISVAASLDLRPASYPSEMAMALVYVAGEETYLDVLNTLASAATAAWTYAGSTITASRLADPGGETAVMTYTEADMAASGSASLRKLVPADDDRGIPAWRVILKYARNYAVDVGSLAGATSAADVANRGREWWTTSASDASVKTQWPGASEITVETSIAHQQYTQDEADRLLALYKVRRDMLEFEVAVPLVGDDFAALGDYVSIEHSRFGLSAGKNFAVIGRRFNVDRGTCTFTVWG